MTNHAPNGLYVDHDIDQRILVGAILEARGLSVQDCEICSQCPGACFNGRFRCCDHLLQAAGYDGFATRRGDQRGRTVGSDHPPFWAAASASGKTGKC